MTIFLIGMPGSGKTVIGNYLAEKLQLPFYDTDNIIASIEGMSMSQIFEIHGESYFRNLEAELMKTWKLHNAVIATGGGLPCHNDIMALLNNNGITIWLKAPIDILSQRLENKSNDRPLLKDINIKNWIKHTLKDRKLFYSQAKIKINANEAITIVANRIISKLYSIKIKDDLK